MKKTYIKPSIETVNVSTQQIIAASPSGDTFSFKDESGWGSLNNESASGDALSRGGNLWDEWD